MLTRRFDPYDDAACARAYQVREAAMGLGRPWHRPTSLAESVLAWRHDDPGERMEMWAAVEQGTDAGLSGNEDDGVVVGIGILWLALDDNTDKAWIEVVVHPDHRRRGAGRALVQRMVDSAREDGRTEVLAELLVPAGDADPVPAHPHRSFAQALGFVTTSTDIVRHLLLPVDPELLDSLAARARPHWVGDYRLETHVDGVPEPLQEGLCAVMNRLGVDAPTGEVSFEPEALTPVRYVDLLRLMRQQGRHQLTTVAVHAPTGSVVAYTDLVVLAEPSPAVWQWGTLVDAPHRGHRLGMAVKVANLQALTRDHPGRERVITSNDDTNRWMVAVNDALGFEVVELMPAVRQVLRASSAAGS